MKADRKIDITDLGNLKYLIEKYEEVQDLNNFSNKEIAGGVIFRILREVGDALFKYSFLFSEESKENKLILEIRKNIRELKKLVRNR